MSATTFDLRRDKTNMGPLVCHWMRSSEGAIKCAWTHAAPTTPARPAYLSDSSPEDDCATSDQPTTGRRVDRRHVLHGMVIIVVLATTALATLISFAGELTTR
jgi:hypothetical protein